MKSVILSLFQNPVGAEVTRLRHLGNQRLLTSSPTVLKAPLLFQAALAVALAAAGASEATNAPSPVLTTEPRRWSLSLRWENDMFAGTDRFYTDGISLSLLHTGGGWLEPVADWLPWGKGRHCVCYDVGQIMITSGNKLLPIPYPNDRPYAGILYGGLSLHIDRDNSYHGLKVIGGVVGPWSYAEQTQKLVHRWVGSPQPQGWDYQLNNEPIFNLVYEYRHKFRLLGGPRGLAVEALPTGTVMLGNMLTQGQVGGQVRFGYNLPDDFGLALIGGMGQLPPPRLDPDPRMRAKTGVYVYGGLQGSLVLHNITLDGNTWQDSPSVDKNYLVPSAEVGVAVASRRFLAAFSYVFLGREFKGQPDPSEFGAFTVTYRF